MDMNTALAASVALISDPNFPNLTVTTNNGGMIAGKLSGSGFTETDIVLAVSRADGKTSYNVSIAVERITSIVPAVNVHSRVGYDNGDVATIHSDGKLTYFRTADRTWIMSELRMFNSADINDWFVARIDESAAFRKMVAGKL